MAIEFKKNAFVYLSGPITGLPYDNRDAFAEYEQKLRDMGAYAVFNPASSKATPKVTHFTHKGYMVRDLNILTNHDHGEPIIDVIAMMPGWEDSEGAKLEWAVAKACGIEVMYL